MDGYAFNVETQGYCAYYPSGAPLLVCPYPIGSTDRDWWMAGWAKAAADLKVRIESVGAVHSPVDAAMRKLRLAGPGAELADAVKELVEAILEGRS